jgi:hypothetical protein
MSAIERIMKAYASKHDLNVEQAARVRAELSSFIGELMSGMRREPTMLPEKNHATSRHPQRGGVAESSSEIFERTGFDGR